MWGYQNFHRGYARAMNLRASPKGETFTGGSSERFKESRTLRGLFAELSGAKAKFTGAMLGL